jgi:serine/threonine protein kinase
LSRFRLESGRTSEHFQTGELVADRFKIIRFIAAGGMGEVYEAEDIELKAGRAIKIIRPEILSQSNAGARFRREVRLAQQVTYPNVCRVFDIFRHKSGVSGIDEVWLVSMELLHGETLADRLRDRGRMSLTEALPLINQMASGLGAAHRAGIVHRDFKPGNVMLVASEDDANGRAVVTDFGLAEQQLTGELATIYARLPTRLHLLRHLERNVAVQCRTVRGRHRHRAAARSGGNGRGDFRSGNDLERGCGSIEADGARSRQIRSQDGHLRLRRARRGDGLDEWSQPGGEAEDDAVAVVPLVSNSRGPFRAAPSVPVKVYRVVNPPVEVILKTVPVPLFAPPPDVGP